MRIMPRPPLARLLSGIARRLVGDRRAATAVEYGLLLTFIALTALTAMSGMTDALKGTFNVIAANLMSAR